MIPLQTKLEMAKAKERVAEGSVAVTLDMVPWVMMVGMGYDGILHWYGSG